MLNYFVKCLLKTLTKGKLSTGGRNYLGRVCTIGRGGGNKRLYRFIDFYRRLNAYGVVYKVLYDPNRTSRICFVMFVNGLQSCVLKLQEQKYRSIFFCGSNFNLLKEETKSENLKWCSLPLKFINLFSFVSNIEGKPFTGGSICRAAGVGCVFLGKTTTTGILKLRSGWHLNVSLDSMASIGKIDKRFKNNIVIGSAGKNRSLGFRPKVRGVAMNPCDHPHGGGNGKKAKPPVPVNAWSTVFKWEHTKKKKIERIKRYKFKTIFE